MKPYAEAVDKLLMGEPAVIRYNGEIMLPIIKPGAKISLIPATEYAVGDTVLCLVNGKHVVRTIKEITDGIATLVTAKGSITGKTELANVYGRMII